MVHHRCCLLSTAFHFLVLPSFNILSSWHNPLQYDRQAQGPLPFLFSGVHSMKVLSSCNVLIGWDGVGGVKKTFWRAQEPYVHQYINLNLNIPMIPTSYSLMDVAANRNKEKWVMPEAQWKQLHFGDWWAWCSVTGLLQEVRWQRNSLLNSGRACHLCLHKGVMSHRVSVNNYFKWKYFKIQT